MRFQDMSEIRRGMRENNGSEGKGMAGPSKLDGSDGKSDGMREGMSMRESAHILKTIS